MPLTLYRRHRKGCEGRHTEDSRSGEFEEGRRGWKRCACVIHASGTISGKFSRKQTGKSDWDEARGIAAAREKEGSWSREKAAPAPQIVTAPAPSHAKITIDRAIAAFLGEHSETSAVNTQKNYKLQLNKLKAYSAQKGYMRFRGLAKNDPRVAQYQLWIFDKTRDDTYPVDGGVFDVDKDTGDVIVPIRAKINVNEATLFAVTIERPGGVVVSKRERIVVTAKLGG